MFAVHAYKSSSDDMNTLILMTQFLSVITFKKNNPNIPFKLYTDTKTLTIYNRFGISGIYDEINTEVLDEYPSDRISENFWASPKLWVMKHITDPFIMMDTDLIWHDVVDDYLSYDLVYLHQEPGTSYPYPNRLSYPDGFDWNDGLLDSFGQSQPINCALCVWNNIDFMKNYVDVYFEFVLDNPGTMNLMDGDMRFIHESGVQITSEQWLLGACEYYWDSNVSKLNTHSLLNILAFPDVLKPYNPNEPREVAMQSLNEHIFHLWGAKSYFDKGDYEGHIQVCDDLTSAISSHVASNPHNNLYRVIRDTLVESLPEIPESNN